MDKVEHSRNGAPRAMTEIHFGLHSAEARTSRDAAGPDRGQRTENCCRMCGGAVFTRPSDERNHKADSASVRLYTVVSRAANGANVGTGQYCKCLHFSWDRGHLALVDATRAGGPPFQACVTPCVSAYLRKAIPRAVPELSRLNASQTHCTRRVSEWSFHSDQCR